MRHAARRRSGDRAPVKLAIDARKAYDGGIGRYIRCLARALVDLEPTLELSLLAPPSMPDFLPGASRVAYDAGLYTVRELFETGARVRRAGSELFHEPHYTLPFRIPVPSVVTIHDTIHLDRAEHLGPVRRGYARAMLRSAARRAAQVITVSECARRDIVRHTGIDAARVTVTPLGVEPAFFDVPAELGRRARRTLGLEAPFVLFVGALKRHKNPIGLVEAFVAADLPEAHLVFVGSGSEDIAGRARARGVAERVIVRTADDEVLRGLYREARIFVMPSLYEGFGLPLLEAMAAGTAAIASRAASIPEVGGDTPVYVTPGDHAELAGALRRLWTDEEERRARAEAARARARSFTWARTAEATRDVYRRALTGAIR